MKIEKITVKLDEKERELNAAKEELSDEKNKSLNLSSELESEQKVIEGLNVCIAQLKQDKIKYIKRLNYYKRQSKNKIIFVGSVDRESSQQLQMWFSEHFFAPKLAA